jgi:MraZ protein
VLDRFIGSPEHKLDGKGRVSLPSSYRDVLAQFGSPQDFVLIPAPLIEGEDPCHVCMTPKGHTQLIESLGEIEFASAQEERLTRQRYIGNARPIAVEDGGRFVLSKDLRDALGLTDRVQFVGDGGTFQIWQPETHARLTAPQPEVRPRRISLSRIGP